MSRTSRVSLRPETQNDLDFLRDLVFAVRETEPGFRALDLSERTRLLAEQFQLQHRDYHLRFPNAHFLIIEADQKPIGRFYLNHDIDHILIVELSILPAFQNFGIGTQLLKTVIAEATRTQIPIHLSVVIGNPAENFYRALQFKPVKSTGSHIEMTWTPSPLP